MEDQPLPADASPTALSPDYVVDFDSEKDEKDPKEDPAYYPADRGNNDDDESSNDDDDDDDVEKDEEDKEEEELEAMANEPMTVPVIEEVAEPVAEAEEEQVVALVVDIKEENMAAPMMDMEEDLAALFGEDDDFKDDDFSDDDSEEVEEEEEEVWEVNEEWLMDPVTPPPVLADLSTHLGNLEYGHGQLMMKVTQVSDAEVAAGVSIEEISPRVFAIEGNVQVMASQMVHATDR
uniref:Uncharacterized protein n=1 Tax=Tanacetum cinerariifolium TaxID=118510 RepID=A0A6L2J8C2_TANCI|nr:hypothetical protein [Tanacetum cinerariifolium]